MPGLGCSMWDLIPWPAVESRRPALWERGSATGAQGSPGVLFLLQPISSMWCQFVPSLMVFALITFLIWYLLGLSLGGSVVKNLPVMQETWVQSLGQEDPHGSGHRNPLQYSCLENPIDRGAWQATVRRVTKSWTQLKQLNTHTGLSLKSYIFPFVINE